MKLTNPVKTIKERIFQMKLMHGRLATGTWLNVMKIEINQHGTYVKGNTHGRTQTDMQDYTAQMKTYNKNEET